MKKCEKYKKRFSHSFSRNFQFHRRDPITDKMHLLCGSFWLEDCRSSIYFSVDPLSQRLWHAPYFTVQCDLLCENTKIKKENDGLLIDLDSFRLLFTKIWAPLSWFSTDEFWAKTFRFLRYSRKMLPFQLATFWYVLQILWHHLSFFYWLQYSDGKGWTETFFRVMVKFSNFEKKYCLVIQYQKFILKCNS